MANTTLSSREFNLHFSEAKKAADRGPVFITDRGHPSYVLLNIAEYQRLIGKSRKIADLLATPGDAAIDPVIPPMRDIAQPADLY